MYGLYEMIIISYHQVKNNLVMGNTRIQQVYNNYFNYLPNNLYSLSN